MKSERIGLTGSLRFLHAPAHAGIHGLGSAPGRMREPGDVCARQRATQDAADVDRHLDVCARGCGDALDAVQIATQHVGVERDDVRPPASPSSGPVPQWRPRQKPPPAPAAASRSPAKPATDAPPSLRSRPCPTARAIARRSRRSRRTFSSDPPRHTGLSSRLNPIPAVRQRATCRSRVRHEVGGSWRAAARVRPGRRRKSQTPRPPPSRPADQEAHRRNCSPPKTSSPPVREAAISLTRKTCRVGNGAD